MSANMTFIRTYTSELVRACLEKRSLDKAPSDAELTTIYEVASKGHMQYLFLYPLLKCVENQDYAEKFNSALRISTFRTFTQVMCAKEISYALESAHIKHQLLKGSILKKIYPSAEMREMSDVDLVIYEKSLDETARVLEGMGYTNNGLIKHHMIFTSKTGVHVEVHWCLYDQNVDYAQYVYFKDNLNAKLVEGKSFTYEFGIEDFYVYMISHMAKHFFETGCGIRNLLDIYIYMNKYQDSMDSSYLKKQLKSLGTYDFEENMRELAYIWIDDKPCSEFYENLFQYMVECGIYGHTENGVWSQLAKETKNSKFIKMHYYFPSIKFMREKYSWLNSMPFLLPFAWIMRAFSGISSDQGKKHMETVKDSSDNTLKMLEIYHRMNLNFRKK